MFSIIYSILFLEENRGRIVGMHEAGFTKAQISNAIGCSRKTAQLWVKRHRLGGINALMDHRHYNHGSWKTTQVQDETIHEFFTEVNPFASSTTFVNVVNANVSGLTVRRRLKEMGLNCCHLNKKVRLTNHHHEARVGCGLQYLAEPFEYWTNVIGMDEKSCSTAEDGRLSV